MRIALLSDIHANLPALESCLKSIALHKPDAIYCLGDLVGYNIWPNEVIQLIRHHGIPTIAGNYDYGIGLESNDCGCAYKTDIDKEMGAQSIRYTNAVIGDDEREYLRTLQREIRIELSAGSSRITLLLVHGSPRKINEYLFEDRDPESFLRMMEKAETDIMCFGHTHLPFHKILPYTSHGENKIRHAINIGSVGKPKDRNPKGGYVLLTIPSSIPPDDTLGIKVEFIRFDYDVERAAKAIERSVLPDAYADMLRNGY